MIVTPKMYVLKQDVLTLTAYCYMNPGDFMAKFDLDELLIKYAKLERIEKLGLRLIEGGKQPSNPSTDFDRQIS